VRQVRAVFDTDRNCDQDSTGSDLSQLENSYTGEGVATSKPAKHSLIRYLDDARCIEERCPEGYMAKW
jgi:hypothetical protein